MTAQDKAQVAAYKKLKQTGEYAAIYGYSFPGQGKIYLSKPIIKRSQEDVQDFNCCKYNNDIYLLTCFINFSI